ncbi:hypothetical protein [Kitasatospora sp. NPDC051914]|uniref:hypothetical protein n=1 Tax=Kitasatospora sp. NPDC051914 TaxID=3154945 RepID=UPI003436DA43
MRWQSDPHAQRPLRASALAAAAALLLAVPAHATSRSAAAAPHRAAGETVTTTLYEAIDVLPVADEDRTGYVRTAFRHRIDADKDGCDTRKEVLVAEATEAPAVGPK